MLSHKLAESDEEGSLKELWMGLKVSIIGPSLEQLGKAKWNTKGWISAENLNRYAKATLHNSPNFHNPRQEVILSAKSVTGMKLQTAWKCRHHQKFRRAFQTHALLFGKGTTSARNAL